MIIGTDVSLKECKSEGYLMMRYDARKKFNPDIQVTFIQWEPDYIDFPGKEEVILDTHCIWEEYECYKKGIDSLIGMEHKFPTTYYELLRVTDSVNAYITIFY